MPWEIVIVDRSGNETVPLGSRERVAAVLSAALPGANLEQPPRPPKAVLDEMPQVLREAFEHPKLAALYEGENFSIEFYAEDAPVLHRVYADVRGNGDPLPALAAICKNENWCIVNCADKTIVDLTLRSDESLWVRFRTFRDKAIKSIKSSGRQ